ncbi:hypothetical protein RO865_01820 [Blautia faecis]|nr:hypothetical protein [Blautia faecis]MDT4367579.1 hypothetical protein [Blautia faecis]
MIFQTRSGAQNIKKTEKISCKNYLLCI